MLLCFLLTTTTAVVSVYANDNYETYQTTSFHANLVADVSEEIEDYHTDLVRTISDLKQMNMVLSLVKDNDPTADFTFRYSAREPFEYQLKQNYLLPFQNSLPYRAAKLKMTLRASGDCSLVSFYGDEVERSSSPGLTFPQPDTIQLSIGWRQVKNPLFLFVPDHCWLHVSVVELRVFRLFFRATRRKIRYSNQNNRPPEVIGLMDVIHNVDLETEYIDSLETFPSLSLLSYTETTATFSFISEDTTYVLPQGLNVVLFQQNLTIWTQDTVKMGFQRKNDEKCNVLMENMPGVTFRELQNGAEFEIELEKHILQTYLPEWRLSVLPDCELRLLEISRTIDFESHVDYTRLFKYGMMTRHRVSSRLAVDDMIMASDLRHTTFIQSLSDFPRLKYRSRGIFSALFRMYGSSRIYILAREVELLLHTVVETPRYKHDTVRMVFGAESPNCRLEIVEKNLAELEGLTILSSRRGFIVTHESHLLHANFPEKTEFVLKSSCDLSLLTVSRTISPGIFIQTAEIDLN